MIKYKKTAEELDNNYAQNLWKPLIDDFVFVPAGTSVEGSKKLDYDTLKKVGTIDVYQRTQQSGIGLDVASIVKRLSSGSLIVRAPTLDQYDMETEVTDQPNTGESEKENVEKAVSDDKSEVPQSGCEPEASVPEKTGTESNQSGNEEK
jgi:hypothetical protein